MYGYETDNVSETSHLSKMTQNYIACQIKKSQTSDTGKRWKNRQNSLVQCLKQQREISNFCKF